MPKPAPCCGKPRLARSPVRLPVANGVVYISSGNGAASNSTYALNATTGAILWSVDLKGGNGSSPAVANGVVYLGTANGIMYALDASTGAALWSDKLVGTLTSPVVANGVVYNTVGSGRAFAFSVK